MTRELTSLFVCYTPSNVLSMGWVPAKNFLSNWSTFKKKNMRVSHNNLHKTCVVSVWRSNVHV